MIKAHSPRCKTFFTFNGNIGKAWETMFSFLFKNAKNDLKTKKVFTNNFKTDNL